MMDIEAVIVALIGIFGVLLMILAFGDLYGGEWQEVGQNVAPVTIAIIVFATVMAGIAYWRKS